MSNEQDQDIQIGPPPLLEPRSSSNVVKVFGVLALLAIIAGAASYVWLNYDRLTGVSSPASANAGTPAVEFEETVNLKDFQSFQQQTNDALQSATQDIASQQAELKQLSDQIAALTTKIDALQGPAVPATNRPVASARPAAVAASGRPATAAVASRKPVTPKPAGPISVGGAPLPSASVPQDR